MQQRCVAEHSSIYLGWFPDATPATVRNRGLRLRGGPVRQPVGSGICFGHVSWEQPFFVILASYEVISFENPLSATRNFSTCARSWKSV